MSNCVFPETAKVVFIAFLCYDALFSDNLSISFGLNWLHFLKDLPGGNVFLS